MRNFYSLNILAKPKSPTQKERREGEKMRNEINC